MDGAGGCCFHKDNYSLTVSGTHLPGNGPESTELCFTHFDWPNTTRDVVLGHRLLLRTDVLVFVHSWRAVV